MTRPTPYAPPAPIDPRHRLEGFDCGHPALDGWLRERARANEGKASRTYVVDDAAGTVAAFYALATGSIATREVPRRLRQGLPDPVPVLILGRLAVDRRHARRGLGSGLLKDAMARALRISVEVGTRALIVHAIDDDAFRFYLRHGFQAYPPDGRTLFLPIEVIRGALP